MAKFPSQSKLLYAHAAAVSNDGWTTFTTNNATNDGTVTGQLCLPKDLSIVNRRGYASTTRKGVPLVYRAKIDLFLQDEDGFGLNAAVGSDFCTTLKIDGCQNNWVMRNAAVKWHAARDKMWSKAGIKRSNLGTYAKMGIRYNYDSADDAWVMPTDADGNSFTGGDWDVDIFADEQDADYQLKLVGLGLDEDTATSVTAMQIGLSYLQSRRPPPDDSNLETSEGPAEFSHLNRLLSTTAEYSATADDIHDDVQALGDSVPYDNYTTEDVNNDITEPVELGRAIAGLGNAYGSVIVDIPFGIANLRLTHYDAADTNITSSPCIAVEVLDIFEMQG